MNIIAKNKSWKYLFWFGPFLLVAGLTAGLVSEKWGPIPLALIISGIVIIGLWLVWQSYQSNWWGRRSTQAGTNALVVTLVVLVMLGLVNFLGTRYNWRTDLTETELFTLAPQSREVVKNLPQPVKLWVFAGNPNPQDRQLLENYRRQNANFQFEYVDPQAKPGVVKQFGVKEPGAVYLESQGKRQLVQSVNENERLSEVKLTNRLQQITSDRTTKVYLLQGHGEHTLTAGKEAMSQAVTALGDKSYTTQPLNLAQKSKVPQDAAVVVVSGPKKALFDTEVKALQDYLNQGGNLLLMIDPNTELKLDSLLQQWGVKLDNRLIVDIGGDVGLGPAVPLVTEYGNHPITKDFGKNISLYPLARPVDTTPVVGVEVTPLLRTKSSPDIWAESDQKSEKLQFNQGSDRKGPFTLGVALKRKLSAKANSTPRESRLVVFGNSQFATDGLFEQQLNGDVFLNSVTWLSQQDQQPLSIRPKEAKNRRLNLTGMQASLLAFSSLLVLPLIGLAAAAVLWWKRR